MKRIIILFSVLTLINVLLFSCKEDIQLPLEVEETQKSEVIVEEPEEVIPPSSPTLDYLNVACIVNAAEYGTSGAGINLATGDVYENNDVLNHFHEIDLVYLDYGNTTNANLAVPNSRELSVKEFGSDVQYGWRVKNEGELFRVTPTNDQLRWFNSLKTAAQIKNGVDSFVNVLKLTKSSEDRVRNIANGQLLLFKSLDRGISSVVYVSNVTRGASSGSKSFARLIIKSDASQVIPKAPAASNTLYDKVTEARHYADTIIINYNPAQNAEIFVDFKKKRTYTEAELDALNDYSGVTALFCFKKAGEVKYLYNIAATRIETGYGNAALRNRLLTKSGRQEVWWTRVDVDPNSDYPDKKVYATYPFEELPNYNEKLLAYWDYWSFPTISSHITNQPNQEMVFRIHFTRSGTRVEGGAFKVLDNVTGRYTIVVKYPNSLD